MSKLKFEKKKVSELSMGAHVRKYSRIYRLELRNIHSSLTGCGSYWAFVTHEHVPGPFAFRRQWEKVKEYREYLSLWDWETVEVLKPETIAL